MSFAELRRREFSRLDATGVAYLDYTGSALPLEGHLTWHLDVLRSVIFGNPHSASATAAVSEECIEHAKAAVLSFVDADPGEYDVVFTTNASAAAKLVAESFPFGRRSRLVLTADNHNSILGLREFARRAGATTAYVPLDAELRLQGARLAIGGEVPAGPSLLAFPAQSNFSGVQHPLALVRLARGLGYRVLLDAAAYVPTTGLSLRAVGADFVTLSLYKVTGYPTGVGALVARHQSLHELRRPWFAGGTVEFASVQNDLHLLRPGAAGFEDGTPNFLALSAIAYGLDCLREIGMDRIGEHVSRLTQRLISGLIALRHRNGRRVVTLYGPLDLAGRGGTVAFNLRDRHGRWIDAVDVERGLSGRHVSVRSGCFCNPGAAEQALGFDAERAGNCVARSLRAGEAPRFSLEAFRRCQDGSAVGAVRASVGLATNDHDVERLIGALEEWAD